MEIIIHTIQELNRCLNLGIYLLVDSRNIVLMSLTTGQALVTLNSAQTLDMYQYLVKLKEKVTQWNYCVMQDKQNSASVIRGQIYNTYNFDVLQHYQFKKYGQI